MKRISLLLLFLTVFGVSISAQHLSLKGHQITGNVELFISSLIKDGFWQDPSDHGLLYGTYSNIPAIFTFCSSPTSNTVYQVEVSITTSVQEQLDFKKYWHSLNNGQKKTIIKSDKYDYNKNKFDNEKMKWSIIVDAESNNPSLSLLVAKKSLEYTDEGLEMAKKGYMGYEGLYEKKPSISLYQAYYDVKDALTKKYGKPKSVNEKKEYGEYDCVFSVSSGTIEVKYGGYPYSNCVSIVLTDKQNAVVAKKEGAQSNVMSKENRFDRATVNVLDL